MLLHRELRRLTGSYAGCLLFADLGFAFDREDP